MASPSRKSSKSAAAKTLKNIKSGTVSRGMALAGVTIATGSKIAGNAFKNLFASAEVKASDRKSLIISQIGALAAQMGELKGSLMKVGQMLSLVGDQFLPPEALAFLKSLRSDTPPLEWEKIRRILARQLGKEKLDELEINPTALACASLGQVHRARVKADGRELAVKIRYPGVDKAIDSDLQSLRMLMSLASFIPKGPDYDEIFAEVRSMLKQEVDYAKERLRTEEFRALVAGDARYIVPQTHKDFSSSGVLATTFEAGEILDGPAVMGLSQSRRNRLAEAGMELFFRELFDWRKMQTDPHFGNYSVRIDQSGSADRLILLDFGAVREFPAEFMGHYQKLLRAIVDGDRKTYRSESIWFNVLAAGDSDEYFEYSWTLSRLFAEPFLEPGDKSVPKHLWIKDESGELVYDFGASDLTKRVVKFATTSNPKMMLTMKSRTPPREIIFLNRKMSGVFAMMASLKAQIDARSIIKKWC